MAKTVDAIPQNANAATFSTLMVYFPILFTETPLALSSQAAPTAAQRANSPDLLLVNLDYQLSCHMRKTQKLLSPCVQHHAIPPNKAVD